MTEDSPADKAGLQPVVTQINGESISASQELVNAVKDCEQGAELTFSAQVELRQQSALPDQEEVADSQETLQGTQDSDMVLSPFLRRFGQM